MARQWCPRYMIRRWPMRTWKSRPKTLTPWCKRLAREEGLAGRISAAAAVVGCLQVARRLERTAGGDRHHFPRLRRQIFEREIWKRIGTAFTTGSTESHRESLSRGFLWLRASVVNDFLC